MTTIATWNDSIPVDTVEAALLADADTMATPEGRDLRAAVTLTPGAPVDPATVDLDAHQLETYVSLLINVFAVHGDEALRPHLGALAPAGDWPTFVPSVRRMLSYGLTEFLLAASGAPSRWDRLVAVPPAVGEVEWRLYRVDEVMFDAALFDRLDTLLSADLGDYLDIVTSALPTSWSTSLAAQMRYHDELMDTLAPGEDIVNHLLGALLD